MKATKFLFLLTLIFAGLIFSSCSSDNDDDNGGDSTSFGPKNVFTGDLPQIIDYFTIKYNSDGLLQEASNSLEKYTFEYPSQTKSTDNGIIAIMKYDDLEAPEDNYIVEFEIGSNGFANKALQTYADNSTDTWEFKYNSDGQLNYMKRSEGGEVTTITYANGNITDVNVEADFNGDGVINNSDKYIANIIYTSATHANGIENKGCIMLFDITFSIDIDELECAYYAGFLGRGTKKLPLAMTINEGSAYSYSYTYNWTLNAKGYPTKLSYEGGYEGVNFGW